MSPHEDGEPATLAALGDLVEVVAVLRRRCPWDAEQTHRSLVPHLVEESAEVVDAIEVGTEAELREELGDLLLQVVLHARIAEEDGVFDLADVATDIAAKLRRRHPHVFGGEQPPEDLDGSWERRKAAEKGRTSSLDGIATSLPALPRAAKVAHRVRAHGVDVALPDEPIGAEEVGRAVVDLAARADAGGVDVDQAVRSALRDLESRVRSAEA